jgi:hypothetical protein
MYNITEVCKRDLPVADAIGEVAMHRQHAFIVGRVALVYTVNFPTSHNTSVVVIVNFDFFWDFHVTANADTMQFRA